MSTGTSSLLLPVLDPGRARIETQLPSGLTLAEIVAASVPGAKLTQGALRVTLVSDEGSYVPPETLWPRIRPKPGVRVIIRPIPGDDQILRSLLLIAVTIIAPYIAGPQVLGLAAGTLGNALVTTGIAIAGTMLVNALIPPPEPPKVDGRRGEDTYRIDGWRNQARPGSPVPFICGRIRTAPPFAAHPYSEIVGDQQYVRALFLIGYGPLRLSELKIGETPIEDLEDVEVEIREGRDGDDPITLYHQQVIEQAEGVELVDPEAPTLRFTAANVTRASIILNFPSGLFRASATSSAIRTTTVGIVIRARLNGEGDWQEVETLEISARKREAFFRQYTWELPTRGRWQISVARAEPINTNIRFSHRMFLAAIQSFRPEAPIALDKPLALVALRVRATNQLNGPLDSFNAIAEAEGPVHDGQDWTTDAGRTPATAFRLALSGPQSPFPVAPSEIDLDLIARWHEWCVEQGLKYDRVHDEQTSLWDQLRAICAAGRASPRHDGLRWGVVIDWGEELVVDHINPRNSDRFEWHRSYLNPPDGLRIRFPDETNGYEEAERIVPWPGHTGEVVLTEALELPGKVDPDEIWIEARRRMYEIALRPDTFSVMQDGTARVASRGDLVMASHDVLDTVMVAARVKAVEGSLIVLDEEVSVGADYAVRFRVYANDEDPVGQSIVAAIRPAAGPSAAISLKQPGPVPEVGHVVHLGPSSKESLALRIRDIESADVFRSRLVMLAAAPEIDDYLETDVPPAWDGRVGEVLSGSLVAPAVPRFTEIFSGSDGTGERGLLEVHLEPGQGSARVVSAYELDHRLLGASVWVTQTIQAITATALIDTYQTGDNIEFRARALSGLDASPYTPVVTTEIGANDATVPPAVDPASLRVEAGFGHARITGAIPSETSGVQANIYRVPDGVPLDQDAHHVGSIPVFAGTTFEFVDGDATRLDLIDDAAWIANGGWTYTAPTATHTSGQSSDLTQAVSLTSGRYYRVIFETSGVSAGSVTPSFTGGTVQSGTPVTDNGPVRQTLTAGAGNTGLTLSASVPFDGSVSGMSMFEVTSACAPAGLWTYHVEIENDDGIAGAITVATSVEIY